MKFLSGRFLPIAGTISILTAAPGMAQEYFRDLGTSRPSSGIGRLGAGANFFYGNDPYGFESLSNVDLQQEEKNYNIRIGSFDLAIAAGIGFEFNDNITLADQDRLSDVIFRPQLDLDGAIRFSETSRLHLGVGLSYAKYFNYSQYDSDGVLITPNSVVSWTAEVGAFKFTIRDRFSYQQDPFEQPELSNVATYKRWENQAGIQVDWDANQYTKISVGYDLYDLWATDDFYKDQDRSINTVFFRPSYQASSSFTFGLNSSVSFVNYRENIHSDATIWLVGPFVSWRINDYTDLYVEVGYQGTNFYGATTVLTYDPITGLPNGVAGEDTTNSQNIYARVELANRPSEFFRQKLSFTKTTELGFNSNFYDLYHVEYTCEWAFREKTTLRPTVFYEHYTTSGPDGETAHRFGAALGIYHVFSENFTVGLDYRYLVKDSNLPDADYYQNLGFVSLYYKF